MVTKTSNKRGVTAHMIVRNEERFVWFSVMSVLDYVDQMFIYDTGSIDKTVAILSSIDSTKITFKQKGQVDRAGLVRLRNEQVAQTTTEWILVVDSDEIYPEKTIREVKDSMMGTDANILGLVVPFYNWCGDIYHIQPESRGRYRFGDTQGHLNLRGLRNVSDLTVVGHYPLEAYMHQGTKIQDYSDRLVFAQNKFFHAGDLARSSVDTQTLERKRVYERGSRLVEPLPEVLSLPRPSIVSDPWQHRSLAYTALATAINPLKILKRKLG